MGDGGAESLAYFAVGSHKQERSMALHAWFKIAICHFDFTGSYIHMHVYHTPLPLPPWDWVQHVLLAVCCILRIYLVIDLKRVLRPKKNKNRHERERW